MNILFIESLGDGGIAHYTYNLANALAQEKINVILFTTKNFEADNLSPDVRVYNNMFRLAFGLIDIFPSLSKEFGIANFFRRFLKLIEYPFNIIEALYVVKKRNIDIVHIQSINEIELLMILAYKLISVKIFYTIHNVKPRHGELKLLHKFIYRFIYSFCDQLIIHTESGRREIIDIFGIRSHKIISIPHGDYKFFLPDNPINKYTAKNKLGIARSYKTILFFGAIRANKGLENIILALPIITESLSYVKLMIVGEPGEEFKRYSSIIESNHLREYIYEELKYIDNDDVATYFSAADVVVLPYVEVTGSGVLQIAYAFGKPVIATDLDGFKETIENGKNGFLVPIKDIQALAKSVIKILSDEDKIRKMGAHSRFLSDEKFSWRSIANRTLHEYKKYTFVSEQL